MRRVLMAATLCVMSGSAVAQPLNESLVECAVLVDEMLGEDAETGVNPQVDFWIDFEVVLRTSSIARSGNAYWTQMSDVKRALWADRWDGQAPDHRKNARETMDWMDYCLSLADHLDL